MKYKGKEIDHPTLEMVKEYCEKHGVCVDPVKLFIECEQSGWKTKQGKKTKSVEAYVSSRKDFYIENVKVKGERYRNRKKKSKEQKFTKSIKKDIPWWNDKELDIIPPALENTKKPAERKSYSELLKDPRWQKRRLEIYTRDNWTCQLCGSGLNDGVPLNIHHRVYHRGRKPWEYNDDELLTICEKCHTKLHGK